MKSNQIVLTGEEIELNIEAYQNRLNRAEAKLNGLPGKLKGKKLRETRRVLLSEIRHVWQLIEYATDALSEMVD